MFHMATAKDSSAEDLIKNGVANHLALQELNPKAINDGIDPRKSFDADTHLTSSLVSQGERMEDSSENPPGLNEVATSGVVSVEESADPPTNPGLEVILPDGTQFGEVAEEDQINGNGGFSQKGKKKKKPKSQRGLLISIVQKGATGFEEYYVDPPITPEQHHEEKGLYDMWRYVARRNLNSDRKNLFDKYLTFGGIEGGPNMFSGGLDRCTLENSNAAEIATLTATHSVAFDKSDPRNETYVVDFEGCLKAFLYVGYCVSGISTVLNALRSSRLPAILELIEEEKIKDYVGVIRNFLNYLLYHDVCPEYRDQVEASRRICHKAETELIGIAQAKALLPGTFNIACSEIFGGIFQGIYSPSETWMNDNNTDQSVGISPQHARQVFRIGLAAYASDEQIDRYKSESKEQSFSVLSEEDVGLEVTSITLGRSLPEIQALYIRDEAKSLSILGRLQAKTWRSPSAPEEDRTEDEDAELAAHPPTDKEYEFWADDVLIEKLSVGMKFEATVKQLSFGIWFFDAVFGIHCSFFTSLPNEMIIGWKKVEREWLPPRPAPGNDSEASEKDDKEAIGVTTETREE
ncbi:MAG: hypothetical protein Q9163_002820 [Psora crenata]